MLGPITQTTSQSHLPLQITVHVLLDIFTQSINLSAITFCHCEYSAIANNMVSFDLAVIAEPLHPLLGSCICAKRWVEGQQSVHCAQEEMQAAGNLETAEGSCNPLYTLTLERKSWHMTNPTLSPCCSHNLHVSQRIQAFRL